MFKQSWGRRLMSNAVKISEEVKQALHDRKKPVIALESTIISHGLPFPQNLEMARSVENTIRDKGGIPATCAFIEGKPMVGLEENHLQSLADVKVSSPLKVSRRDIGYTMALKHNGGTTIASTMILAEKAGIKVFATGGLGGVHRDGQNTLDVSADLTELGRTPVAVVCAGPKSILDIGLTLEFLETQGVFVGTYNDDGRESIEIPGFYARNSGFKSPHSFSSFAEAGRIIYNQNSVMNLKSGSVFCIPPPVSSALPSELINQAIEVANLEAKQLGVEGKRLTPFLLAKIAEITKGQSVASNIELVLNNARAATEIATSLLSFENNKNPSFSSSVLHPITRNVTSSTGIANVVKEEEKSKMVNTAKHDDNANTLIVGSIALDSICKIDNSEHMGDSNPGKITNSIGGVGYNVYKACNLALQSPSCSDPKKSSASRLVSVIGDDMAGSTIVSQLSITAQDYSSILKIKEGSTAQYTSMHNKDGELLVACADMSIIEKDFSQHIIEQIHKNQPKQVIIDCNLSATCLSKVLSYIKSDHNCDVIIEPTSSVKCQKIAQVNSQCLQAYPSNVISLITPTIKELEGIHHSFAQRELFDDYDNWFPILDNLGINRQFTDKILASQIPALTDGLLDGYLQRAFKLLPYIPNILLKLGEKGVILIKISTNIDDYRSLPTVSPFKPQVIITSKGKTYGNNSNAMGVAIEFFPIPQQNRNLNIENVTGAGDSFLGYLAATLSVSNSKLEEGSWLRQELNSVEQEWFMWESIYKAQVASGMSLMSKESISADIKHIK